MMQQARDFLDESEALYALIEPLADAALENKTAFKDWTTNHIVRHLHFWNLAAEMSLNADRKFDELVKRVLGHIDGGLAGFESRYLDGLSGVALVSAWRDACHVVAEAFGNVDPSRRVNWVGVEMSARSSITARLMETWAHAQAVYDAQGKYRQNTDRIGNIVVLGVNTYRWTYRVRGQTPPGPMPYLKLTAPSGVLWTYGDASETELIEGPAEAFCQVVTQVRNVADTTLSVTGSTASDWMSKAQCFAGPPETPPAPGTRTIAADPGAAPAP